MLRIRNIYKDCTEYALSWSLGYSFPNISDSTYIMCQYVSQSSALPSITKNHYLNLSGWIFWFSYFPFTITCPDIMSEIVIKYLNQVFTIFDTPSFILIADSFQLRELKKNDGPKPRRSEEMVCASVITCWYGDIY